MKSTGTFTRVLVVSLAFGASALRPVASLAHPIENASGRAVAPVLPQRSEHGDAYGQLPLAFVEEDGGGMVARGRGHIVSIEDGAATFAGPDGAIRLHFGRATSLRAEDALPGVANFFIGNDPTKWRQGVPTYRRARLQSVAPGVDVVFYGTTDRPEYDFVIAPRTSPSAARMTVEGATRIHVDANGDLIVKTATGEIRQPKPAIYQESIEGTLEVSGKYVVDGATVRVDVGAYDSSLPLIIDPVLAYASYLGGNGDDRIESAVTDPAGNLYVCGSTLSSNFPTQGSLQSNQSGMDGFVSKVNSSGTALLFSTYIGGDATDDFNDVAVNGSHVYVTGASASGNYPMQNGFDSTPNGLDAVLTVLNLAGSAITYSTCIGGGNNDIGNAVAVDIHGNAYMAGETLDSSGIFNRNFPTKSPSSLDPFQKDFGGGRSDAFVCKFDPDESGNGSLVYSTLLGGSEGEGVEDIVVDDNERAYVCGYTESANFDRLNALQNTYGGGNTDGFVTKFNADGTAIFYSTFYGGNAIDEAFSIALDTSTGTPLPVVVGHSTSPNLQTQLAIQPSKSGPEDCFALKLNDAGTSLVYATYFGGPGNDAANAVTVDVSGNSYFTGFSNNTYPLLNPIPVNGTIATSGVVVTKLSPSGALLLSTCVLSGSGEGIGLDSVGNIYVAGTTSLTNFPVTAGAFQTTFHGAPNDGFVFKFDIVDDDTIGVFKTSPRQFQLRNSNSSGAADITFSFGAAGDRPIVGDWDGDGVSTIGTYSPSTGTFSLRNSNSAGAPFTTFVFGGPNLVPIAGDWDGDGVDTIGVYDPTTGAYFLKNSLAGGNADLQFFFGLGGQGSIPISGDWDGDGIDTIGFWTPSNRTFFLRNSNSNGNADLSFVFGTASSKPVAGDWNGDGIDTIGTFTPGLLPILPATFALRNTNSAGSADLAAAFGASGDTPVVGNWDGQ